MRPAALPSGLGNPAEDRGERHRLGKPSCCLVTAALGAGVQPSAGTAATRPSRAAFPERSFPSQKLWAQRRSTRRSQRRRTAPKAAAASVAKARHPAGRRVGAGARARPISPGQLPQGVGWPGAPRTCISGSFCQRSHVLLNKSRGRKKVSVSITKE